MKTIELVKQLQVQGYKVTYRVRTDGGILITSINGRKFKAAEGNIRAREILGVELSTRRAMQLRKITRTRRIKRPKVVTPESLEIQRKRVVRKWRKAGLSGSIAKSNLEAIIRDRGIKGAKEYLDNMEKRAEGYANEGEIEALLQRLEQDIYSSDDEEIEDIQKMIDYIRDHRDNFPQKNIFKIFDEIYNWENGTISSSELIHRFFMMVD